MEELKKLEEDQENIRPQSPTRLFILVTVSIFVAEIIIMFLMPLLQPMSNAAAAIIDSLLLTMLVAPFIYYFIHRPFENYIEKHIKAENELRKLAKSLDDKVKKSTEELALSEAEHQSVLESSADAIMRINMNEIIHSANRSACKLFGYKKKELIGMNISVIIPDEFSKIVAEGAAASLEEWSGEDTHKTIELNAMAKGGKTIPVDVAVSECIIESEFFFVIIIRDITNRKMAENSLRASQTSLKHAQRVAKLGNWDLDLGTNELNFSEEVSQILGLKDGELKATYEVFLEYVHPEDRELVEKKLAQAIFDNQKYNIDYRIIRMDGSERVIHAQADLVNDEGGHALRMIGTVQDVTERKRAEEKLRIAMEKAEDATRLKDKFVSLVAHDLKSPFASMLGLLRMMEDDNENKLHPEQREVVARVLSCGDGLVSMIDELLNISRLQTGKLEINKQFLDVRRIVTLVLSNQQHAASEKGISLTNDIPKGMRLYADLNLFAGVIQNLLSNSIKFCKKGDAITIFVPPEKKTTIAVKDTGTGIDEKMLPMLFRHEEHTTTLGTSGEKGTGLGLPFSSDIMKVHGGSLTLESIVGKGSTFYAELPDVKAVILVAEGENEAREIIVNQITNSINSEVIAVENGEQAINALKNKKPHLILADLNMPGLDGYALLKQVKENPETESVPVILMAKTETEDDTQAFDLGADDFVTRPVSAEELAERIMKCIG